MSCENYDPCYPDQPVVDLYLPLWANQPAFKSKPAFVWADDAPPNSLTWKSSITYSQLNSSVQSIAFTLLSSLHRGDTLLILCSPGIQLVKIIFACQRAGLVALPITPLNLSELSSSSSNQTSSYHHFLRALIQVNPKAAVANHQYISALTKFASKSTSDTLGQLLNNLLWLPTEKIMDVIIGGAATSVGGENYSGCGPDEPYLVQYTSGATGIPKPVIVTAGAAAHNVREARKAYDLQPSSIIVSWLPQYHDCGLMFLLLSVITGATCVLTSPFAFLNRPRLWLELISEFKATSTPVPSFALPLVVRRGGVNKGTFPLNLASLRNLILINEPIYHSPVQEFVEEFMSVGLNPSSIAPSYGLAENCTFASTAWQCSSNYSFPNMPSYKNLLPSARLTAGTEEIKIVVVNEDTCEAIEDDGVEGEVWISSASNALGYLGHPDLSHEVFNARLRGSISSRCFVRTGDRGVINKAGEERYLYILGRASDVIRVDSNHPNVVHPHYLETAAYNSNPEHLRGGCIVALGVERPSSNGRDELVVVIAELQKRSGEISSNTNNYNNNKKKKKICEGIREGVMKKEGVGVGLVVLVEGGSVPKTTSGKLRRFLAKDIMLSGKFQVVCKVEFEENNSFSNGRLDEQVKGEAGALSLTGANPRLNLQSFL